MSQIGLIDAADCEASGAHSALAYEVGEYPVARLDAQFACHILRYEYAVGALLVGEVGDAALHHTLVYEGGVEFWSHALEHHAQEVVVGLQYALLHGEALHVLHAVSSFQYVHHRVAYGYWLVDG